MKLVILLIVSSILSACAGSVDNAEPPASLLDIKESAKLTLIHELEYGDSASQYMRIKALELPKEIVFSDSNGKVTVFDKKSFKIRWQKTFDVEFTSAIGGNEKIYVLATRSGEVLAINPLSGDVNWQVAVSSEVLTSPVVSAGRIIVKTVDGQLSALNSETGKQAWVYQREVPALSVRGNSQPYLLDDKVITGLDNGKLVILNVATGELFWEKTISTPHGRSEIERLVDLDADLIMRDNIIYIAGYQGKLVALDLTTGSFLWTKKMSVTKKVSIEDNRLYVTDDNSHIWALDASTGGVIWKQTDFTSRKLTSAVIMDDKLLIADYEGYLHIIAKADGHQLGRDRVDSSGIDVSPIIFDEKIYLQSKKSVIYIYELKSLQL